jgi:hypothetical protein
VVLGNDFVINFLPFGLDLSLPWCVRFVETYQGSRHKEREKMVITLKNVRTGETIATYLDGEKVTNICTCVFTKWECKSCDEQLFKEKESNK